VIPEQPWLDGIADSAGTVRQFVAMPFGSGHSVEHQVTGKDSVGSIQFEITPYAPRPGTCNYYRERTPPQHPPGPTQIFVIGILNGKRRTESTLVWNNETSMQLSFHCPFLLLSLLFTLISLLRLPDLAVLDKISPHLSPSSVEVRLTLTKPISAAFSLNA
jgi:hypothetical protein